MSFLVTQLIRIGPLREGLNPTLAAETVWAISSAEVFHLLTVERKWSEGQYVQWLADTLVRYWLP